MCICPSFYWADRFSLVTEPEGLGKKLRRKVVCDSLSIWNFNNLDLHSDAEPMPLKTKGSLTRLFNGFS